MAGMLASPRNRGMQNVDDPWNDDGFYTHRHFKGSRKTGKATGKRGWHRTLRSKSKEEARKIIKQEIN